MRLYSFTGCINSQSPLLECLTVTDLAVQYKVVLVVKLFCRIQGNVVATLGLLILLPVLHLRKKETHYEQIATNKLTENMCTASHSVLLYVIVNKLTI